MSDFEDYFDDEDEYGYWDEEPADGVVSFPVGCFLTPCQR